MLIRSQASWCAWRPTPTAPLKIAPVGGVAQLPALTSGPVSEALLSKAAPAAQSALQLTSVSANCCLPCAILSVVLSIFSVLFSIRSRWPATVKGHSSSQI